MYVCVSMCIPLNFVIQLPHSPHFSTRMEEKKGGRERERDGRRERGGIEGERRKANVQMK